MKNFTEIIRKRKSIRTYSNKEIDKDLFENLEKLYNTSETGPFGNNIEIRIIKNNNSNSGKIGTYGFISNAKYFLICLVNDGISNWSDVGYIFEKYILEFTYLGWGTCWLGGTFSRNKLDHLSNEKKIAVISPFGFYEDSFTLKDKIIRTFSNASRRLELSDIIINYNEVKNFEDNFLIETLENVRLAPSASNKQPWRVFIKKNENKYIFDIYLKRTKGYKNIIPEVDLQKIDIGIAMYHIDSSMEFKGQWQFNNSSQNYLEYITSYIVNI